MTSILLLLFFFVFLVVQNVCELLVDAGVLGRPQLVKKLVNVDLVSPGRASVVIVRILIVLLLLDQLELSEGLCLSLFVEVVRGLPLDFVVLTVGDDWLIVHGCALVHSTEAS